MILLQLLLFCALLTLMVKIAVGSSPLNGLYFYPKPVQERVYALGLTDRDSASRTLERSAWGRIGTLVAVLATMVLVCTALYVMFTPVGESWINGVQHRYLIPVIFPFLMILGSGLISRPLKLDIPWRRSLYNGLFFAFTAFVLMNGIWETCVSRFVG